MFLYHAFFLWLHGFFSFKLIGHTLDFKLRSSVPQILGVSTMWQALGEMLETQVGIRQNS